MVIDMKEQMRFFICEMFMNGSTNLGICRKNMNAKKGILKGT